jgi:amylosucrase
MPDDWLQEQAQLTIARLLPRIEDRFADREAYSVFVDRLRRHFPRALGHLLRLYGDQYDFFYHLEQIFITLAETSAARSPDLRALDARREADPHWFRQVEMIGGVCYVDLFAGDLEGLRRHIPYFKELGLTYLHLMPLFRAPEENSDGGYAISDYRQIAPALGTMEQLAGLAAELRQNGISLVLDFVFNHTSDEHEWALRALAGEERYRRFYYIFPDRALPDQYERHLREIFPEQAPGSFTYHPELDGWVWTTFNNFQWDLNYGNPEVFNAMLGEMLFLANQGTEILRLDAVAFIWKRLGTPCENLPEVHDIIRALNALVQVVAPAMLFKSEAIVHPDDVASYIAWEECPLSYNPTFMALIWEALATREVKLLRHSMTRRFELPESCAWVNYVRVHDDIGWSFADEDAAEVGIRGFDHRLFLNQFYTGRFEGSFASGVGFNYNPVTQDMRICGTAASLAGLEQALALNDEHLIELALRRILMIHSLIIAAGGIPLLYLGDEIATRNDYSYEQDPARAADQRWVHRPRFDWERAERRHDAAAVEGRVFQGLCHLIQTRKKTPALQGSRTLFFDTLNPHVLGFVRNYRLLVLANFSERPQSLTRDVLAAYWDIPAAPVDVLTGAPVELPQQLTLEPYQYLWLAGEG